MDLELGNALADAVLQKGFEVAGAIWDLFQIACHCEYDVQVILRKGEQVRKELEVPDIIYEKAWAKNLDQTGIHECNSTADGEKRLCRFQGMPDRKVY